MSVRRGVRKSFIKIVPLCVVVKWQCVGHEFGWFEPCSLSLLLCFYSFINWYRYKMFVGNMLASRESHTNNPIIIPVASHCSWLQIVFLYYYFEEEECCWTEYLLCGALLSSGTWLSTVFGRSICNSALSRLGPFDVGASSTRPSRRNPNKRK